MYSNFNFVIKVATIICRNKINLFSTLTVENHQVSSSSLTEKKRHMHVVPLELHPWQTEVGQQEVAAFVVSVAPSFQLNGRNSVAFAAIEDSSFYCVISFDFFLFLLL